MANIRRAGKRVKAIKASDIQALDVQRKKFLKRSARKYGYKAVLSRLKKSLRKNPESQDLINQDIAWVRKLRRRNPTQTKRCSHCLGNGLVFDGVCSECLGDGFIKTRKRQNPIISNSKACPHCLGRGLVYSGICEMCQGGGRISYNPCGVCSIRSVRRNPCGACSIRPVIRRNPDFYNPFKEKANYKPFPEHEVERVLNARRNPFWGR